MMHPRFLAALLALGAAGVARADAVPDCPTATPPADWVRSERAALALTVPPGFTLQTPAVALDFEMASYVYAEGVIVYQYGFDVDELGAIADDPATERCGFSLGARRVELLRFRTAQGEYGFGFHVADIPAFYPETGLLVDDLTVIGVGTTARMHEVAPAVAQALRLSRVPRAASALWQTVGVDAQGVSVHVAGEVGGMLWATYDPATGKPLWLVGVGPLPEVAFRGGTLAGGEARFIALPMTFYTSPQGRFPGRTGPDPATAVWGAGELRIADDCLRGEFAFQGPDGLAGTVPIERLTALDADCARFE